MNIHGEPNSLSRVVHPSPIAGIPFDARVAGSLAMAESFELQPKDIVYVAATPLANWNRNLSLLIPGALPSAVSATNRR